MKKSAALLTQNIIDICTKTVADFVCVEPAEVLSWLDIGMPDVVKKQLMVHQDIFNAWLVIRPAVRLKEALERQADFDMTKEGK